jgi:membrane-associated phospholipid phosphatase
MTDRPISLGPWFLATSGCLAGVPLSVALIDRPVAEFAHAHLEQPFFLALTRIPEAFPMLSPVLVVVLGLAALRRGLSGLPRAALLASVAFVLAIAVKDQLKFAFGRTWPETFVNNNPSFIGSGAYGFHPFHGGPGWASFPSGHMTAITSVMAVLWLLLPRLRALWALLVALVAVGLLGMDYHFVADILAGTWLGAAMGTGTVRLAGAGAAPARP